MATSTELGNNAYQPETKLRTGRMISTKATLPADGAVEATYFFKTFPEFRPVGPFNDPRNSAITRFRLESSDKTGISYVIGRNITSGAIDEIKQEYYGTRLKRRDRKGKQGKRKTIIMKKCKANIRSLSSASEEASSRRTIGTDVQPIVATAPNVHDSSLFETIRALIPPTQNPEPQQVTMIDLLVDKLISEHHLTQDEKRIFLQHVTSLKGREDDGMDIISKMAYLKYCKFLLDRIYPIDQDKEETSSLQTGQRASLIKTENTESLEEVKKSIKELNERVSSRFAEIRGNLLAVTTNLAGSINMDIVLFARETLERVNLLRCLASKPPLANLYELLNEAGRGHASSFGLFKDEETLDKIIESLKKRGYAVLTPGEVIEELRADLNEERRQRQDLEARVRSLEIGVHQAKKADWIPVILMAIILLFILMKP